MVKKPHENDPQQTWYCTWGPPGVCGGGGGGGWIRWATCGWAVIMRNWPAALIGDWSATICWKYTQTRLNTMETFERIVLKKRKVKSIKLLFYRYRLLCRGQVRAGKKRIRKETVFINYLINENMINENIRKRKIRIYRDEKSFFQL